MNRDNDKGKVLLQRTMLVAAVFFVLLMALIGRLYYLQVYQGEKYFNSSFGTAARFGL